MLLPLFAMAILLTGCTQDSSQTMDKTSSSTLVGFDGKLLSGMHTVVIETSKGDITLELDANQAPKTVTNFVVLAQVGYFNGLPFHRVIPDFMIQGGDPNGDGTGGESIFGPTFEDEPSEILMDRGVIAMANRGPDTNGSQFFIIQKEDGTPWLQGKHTAFGKVTKGMNIVDTITNVDRDARDQPLEPITFTVTVIQ